MVVVITFPLAYIQRRNGHIAVTVISDRLLRWVQIAQRLFGNLLLGYFWALWHFCIRKARNLPKSSIMTASLKRQPADENHVCPGHQLFPDPGSSQHLARSAGLTVRL